MTLSGSPLALDDRREAGYRAPLSYAQEALWFLQQLHPESAAYTESWIVRIQVCVEPALLEQSVNEIVRRHEILRTGIRTEEGKPVQVVFPTASSPLRVADLLHLSPAAQDVELGRLVAQEARVFDLECAPLLRTLLLRLAANESAFVFTMHHLVCDGVSAVIFVRELEAIYSAYAERRPSPLAPLSIQYREYATRERSEAGQQLADNLQYWKRALGGLQVTELSPDRPRPPVQSFRGASESAHVSESVAAAVTAFAAQCRATPFMIFLAAFQILLHRYTDQTIITVGSPIAERPTVEVGNLIGLFVNAVVIRVDLSGDPPAGDALARVRDAALSAFAHRQTPFERLVDAVQPGRDLSRNPLFQVAFAFEPCPGESSGLTTKWVGQPASTHSAKFDLTMIVVQEPNGYALRVEYCADLFDAASVCRLIAHYHRLLESVACSPETRLSDLPLLGESELNRLLVEWNGTDRQYRSNATLHGLFREHAERAPDAVAVIHEDNHLTYGEGDRRSDLLARHFRRLGVATEAPVGVTLDRSLEMVIAILGILKAGGAYLPIDPAVPEERRSFLLADSRAAALITTRAIGSPAGFEGPVVFVSELKETGDSSLALSSTPPALAENLACVIYTSGSTGTPKGVAITHRGVCRMISDKANVAIGPSDRLSQMSPFAFDASTFEIWGALLNGAHLVILGREVILSTTALRAHIALHEFSVMFVTTALFHEMARLDPAMWASVSTVLVGGETADPSAFRRVLEFGRPAALVHMYGPAEAVTFASRFMVTCVPDDARSIPIGRPVANLRLYVVDRNLSLTPAGVPGELCVAGDCFARGYLHRPDLTGERFVPDPFGTTPGGRMYRTGDRARHLSDGAIEFLGRMDNQVKLRGYRIEPGEIESVLLGHPSVAQAVVLVQDGRRLTAYVASPSGSAAAAEELRTWLHTKLPDYMVPSAIVVLDRLPRNTNGKIDRNALPAASRLPGNRQYIAPRTAAERLLAEIWSDVLGVPRIGIHDNFFAAGGDSILSIQLVARANRLGLRLTPQAVFQNQTIAELAACGGWTGATEPDRAPGPAPLTPIQRWFFEGCSVDPHHFNQGVCLELQQEVDFGHVQRALEWISRQHGALRFRFSEENGLSQREVWDEAAWPLERIDLAHCSETDLEAAYRHHCSRIGSCLDPVRGPLARAAQFDLGPRRPPRLLLVAHHLVVDAVSWQIILQDLEEACLGLRLGQPLPAPRPTARFQTWAHRLYEYGQSPELRQEMAYWQSLPGRGANIPLDHASGEDNEMSSCTAVFHLDASDTGALLRDVPNAYRTQGNEALLAALLFATSRCTGQHSLLIDLEGHGREPLFAGLDVSRTVGWFTSLFPIYLEIDPHSSVGEALVAVKEQMRAVPKRGIGFGLLRYACSDPEIRRNLSAMPQPRISFNYLGQTDAILRGAKLFRPASHDTGPQSSPRQQRRHELAVDVLVRDGKLQFNWTYSENRHLPETIDRLGREVIESLRAIIRHCAGPDAGAFTPADFPLAKLDHTALQKLWRADSTIDDIYPLSPLQKGMLFHTLSASAPGTYFEQFQFTLHGNVDSATLRRAWDRATLRYPVLRTSFFWDGLDDPVQVVHRYSPLVWEEHDVRGMDAQGRQERMRAFLEHDRQTEFDLQAAPPVRLALFRATNDEHELVWSFHHALLDGWSVSLVLRDVFSCYEDSRLGREHALEPAPRWRDYIEWLAKQDRGQEESFWRAYLRGFKKSTPLPLARLLDPSQPEAYDEATVHLDEETTDALSAWIGGKHLTWNTVFQGAWALLVSRFTQESDVLFASPVSGRPPELHGVDRMAGMFLNTIPVRIRVETSRPVAAWLQDVHRQLAEAHRHQHISLVDARTWSEIPPGQALLESIVIFENYPIDPLLRGAGESLRIVRTTMHEQTTYPLSICAAVGEKCRISAVFDKRRYDRETMRRILAHFCVLLAEISRHPQLPAGNLSFMSPTDQQKLIDWGSGATPQRELRCAHELIEDNAQAVPLAVAVDHAGSALTYFELNRRANQLARRLQSLGVMPEVRVGVCLPRAPDLVISLLAILKAGGAFLPLDPSHPPERLQFMLEDARAAILVTHTSLLGSLPDPGRIRLCIDVDQGGHEPGADTNLGRLSGPEHLAYIIHTSGSSGQPKGVLLTHRGLSNLIAAQAVAFASTRQSRVLQFAPLNFDAAISEIFVTLASGGTLVLATREDMAPGKPLAACLNRHLISLVTLPPSVLDTIPAGEHLRTVRTIVSAGDNCSAELMKRWRGTHDFLNAYGPTEATVCATIDNDGDAERPSIGRPIPGTRVYVLDRSLEILPAGVTGELYVGGEGLARGYLNRPDLTAAAFIPNPLGDVPGDRLYRTGDLCRWLDDGRLEFIGRLDTQVKLRGVRIELGEVEAVLGRQPGVREAAVVVHDAARDDARLVAYIAPERAEDYETGVAVRSFVKNLRAALQRSLPQYMIPAEFVAVESMPRTPSGKLDRKSLPASKFLAAESRPPNAAPPNPAEGILCSIWDGVLGRDCTTPADNFFEVGGHSLNAAKVIARISEALRVNLPIRALFQHPTVTALAAYATCQRERTQPQLQPIERARRTNGLPLSFAQRRLWFVCEFEAGTLMYNCPFALVVRGPLNRAALVRTLAEIVRRHEILRTRFPAADGLPMQIIEPADAFALAEIDQGGADLDALLVADVARPLDLKSGPVIRATLIRKSEQLHILSLVIHHIVCDGWSLGILLDEIAAIYAAFCRDQQHGLEEPAIQYADFAVWQQNSLQGPSFEAAIAYWRTTLRGCPSTIRLPLDRPRPALMSRAGACLTIALPPGLPQLLREITRRRSMTLFMTLLAGFQVLLQRVSGQDDFAIGVAAAGRGPVEVERLIGFFLNMLVVRASVSGNPTFQELLERVRESALEAFAHQEIPFEKLVEELQPQRDAGRASPLFQVAFGLDRPPGTTITAGEVEMTLLEPHVTTARYDLTLWISDRPDGIDASWTYSTELFDPETIARMHRQFAALLTSAVSEPDWRIADLEMSTAAEIALKAAERQGREKARHRRLLDSIPKAVSVGLDRI